MNSHFHTAPAHHCRSRLVALVVAVGLLSAAPTAAQPQGDDAGTTPLPTAGFQDGFFIQSPDGRNRVTIGALMHFDGRFVLADPSPITNTFSMRRIRAGFTARLANIFEVRFTPEFGSGMALIQDMYVDVRFSKAVRVRVGKYKVPLGYEMLITAPRMLLPERALASNLVPNRDVGAQVMGDLAGGRISYAGGVFNGGPDGGSALDAGAASHRRSCTGMVRWGPGPSISGPRRQWRSARRQPRTPTRDGPSPGRTSSPVRPPLLV